LLFVIIHAISIFFEAVANLTVVDSNQQTRTVQSCSTNCIDDTLKNGTAAFIRYIIVLEYAQTIVSTIEGLYEGVASEDTRNALSIIFCGELNTAVILVYTGAALLIVGILGTIILIAYFRWKTNKASGMFGD